MGTLKRLLVQVDQLGRSLLPRLDPPVPNQKQGVRSDCRLRQEAVEPGWCATADLGREVRPLELQLSTSHLDGGRVPNGSDTGPVESIPTVLGLANDPPKIVIDR
jgi:hypothetical protein